MPMRPACSSAARPWPGGEELLRMRPTAPANRHLESLQALEPFSPEISPHQQELRVLLDEVSKILLIAFWTERER